MRKRNVQKIVRLSDEENEQFKSRVKKSGLSQEAYLRHLINGYLPPDAPPPNYYRMMRSLYGIGNNLNQIAQKAHVLNMMDAQRYDRVAQKLDAAIITITEAVVLPRKIE